jgi:CheY-specific phosphatase CheX
MKPKFFGRYLIDKGYVTERQLNEAAVYQMEKVKRIGEIAVEKKYMTSDQVIKVLFEQQKKDKLFGELAADLGFLTIGQLEEALVTQKNNHVFLGQALVEKDILTQEKIDRQLRLFHEEQKSIGGIENIVPENTDYREEIMILVETSVKIFRRMASMLLKPGNGFYRDDVIENQFLISTIDFTGEIGFHFFLNIPRNISLALTENCIGNENREHDDDSMIDCIGEVTNVICGNASSHIHKLRHFLYTPPVRMLRSKIPTWNIKGKKQLVFPASVPLPDGTVEIGIVFDEK